MRLAGVPAKLKLDAVSLRKLATLENRKMVGSSAKLLL